MSRPFRFAARGTCAALLLVAGAIASASAPPSARKALPAVEYTLSFPEPQHRWMQVEVLFTSVAPMPVQVRMSRSSPGRYALHEFAKNVFDVQFEDGQARRLQPARPNLHQWDVAGHDGTVRMRYRVFGDRVDGTYLAIDATHAHINMPAALAWAHGLEDRAARVTFQRPAGSNWRVATQLMPTADPLVFTAPNLQYLLDSPAEFSEFTLRTFDAPLAKAGGPVPLVRIALHHTGTDADADAYAGEVRRIVEQARRLFGEYPAFETTTYTFLADYLPWASSDGMEHRNSTVVSASAPLSGSRTRLLGTVSHEFLHAWNVERIRPRALEPFNFEEANVSGELWLAEGVTSYYDGLLLARAGLIDTPQLLEELGTAVATVMLSPATQFRSAEEMSRMAPFVDAASWIDRTNWDNTYISYYVHGAALGLGLDLAIREHTDGRASLDDFMRAMWRTHGRPGGTRPGYVDTPYTADDVRARLAEVTGDAAFAGEMMRRYVHGREVMDYRRLVASVGLRLGSRFPGRASLGQVEYQRDAQGVSVSAPTRIGSAAYRAGLAEGDVITGLGGEAVGTPEQLETALRKHVPGKQIAVTYRRRSGEVVKVEVALDEDPRIEIVTLESSGEALTDRQRALRAAWLAGK